MAHSDIDDNRSMDEVLNGILDSCRKRDGFDFVRSGSGNCDEHGHYQTRFYKGSDGVEVDNGCPECSRIQREEESEERDRQMARERQEARLSKIIGSAAIPHRFSDRSLDNYQVTEGDSQAKVLQFCKEYADNFDRALEAGTSLIFSGGVGTGKTHLSIGIANRVMQSGHSARFTSVSGLVRRVRASWSDNDESEVDAMRLFSVPKLLIIDEVGLQSGSDNEHQILFEIMNSRYESCRPTILITNLPLRDESSEGQITRKGLQSYIGDRLLDRMREGGGRAFTFNWKSGRLER